MICSPERGSPSLGVTRNVRLRNLPFFVQPTDVSIVASAPSSTQSPTIQESSASGPSGGCPGSWAVRTTLGSTSDGVADPTTGPALGGTGGSCACATAN